ncbi:hypothetical protein K474DRAFT_1712482 [Panus rudis PR-1116 ss-1]|nr:hypothetical protein K474DRAFT_1712482 [Panus rudis PR-1116 ss-1]
MHPPIIPIIPLELLLNVADNLWDDKPTLQNLALTSKVLCNYCRSLIHRSVELHVAKSYKHSSGSPLNRFAQVFADRKIASYVRHLKLQFWQLEDDVSDALAAHLKVFSKFENLEMLHIRSPMLIFALDTDRDSAVWDGLFNAVGRTVKCLHIENILFSSFEQLAKILSKFSNLQALALRQITFCSDPPNVGSQQYSRKALIPLRTLDIENCDALHAFAKYLDLVTTKTVENFRLSVQLDDDLTGIYALCRLVAHSVKHITFEFKPGTMFDPLLWSQEFDKIFEKPAFADMPHLETFTFGDCDLDEIAEIVDIFRAHGFPVVYGVHLARFFSSWIPTVISSVDGTRLHTVNFRFRMQDLHLIKKVPLRRIDRILSDKGHFPQLARVNFQLCAQKGLGTRRERFSRLKRLSRLLSSGVLNVEETMIPANRINLVGIIDALASGGDDANADLLAGINAEDPFEGEDESESEDEDEDVRADFGLEEESFEKHLARYQELLMEDDLRNGEFYRELS